MKFRDKKDSNFEATDLAPAAVNTMNFMLCQGRPAAPMELVRSIVIVLHAPIEVGRENTTSGRTALIGGITCSTVRGIVSHCLQSNTFVVVHCARIVVGSNVTLLPIVIVLLLVLTERYLG